MKIIKLLLIMYLSSYSVFSNEERAMEFPLVLHSVKISTIQDVIAVELELRYYGETPIYFAFARQQEYNNQKFTYGFINKESYIKDLKRDINIFGNTPYHFYSLIAIDTIEFNYFKTELRFVVPSSWRMEKMLNIEDLLELNTFILLLYIYQSNPLIDKDRMTFINLLESNTGHYVKLITNNITIGDNV